MKIWKKMICLISALTMAFGAFGCGGGGEDPVDPPEPDKPVDPPPVTGYQYGEDWADPYDADYTDRLLSLGDQKFTMTQLAGTDGVGRKMTTRSGDQAGKYVGIFYFMWLGQGGHQQICDISKLLESNPSLMYDTQRNPLWVLPGSQYYDGSISPQNMFHYFEEPLYGYYKSSDRWVIKRHLELLTYAGVDFLYLDFTNAGWDGTSAYNIYTESTYALMDTILEMQALGYDVPQVVPMVCNPDTPGGTPNRSRIVQWIYENYYAKDNFKYKSCWFTADSERNPSGKPLLVTYDIAESSFTDQTAYNAFWYKKVVWPTQVNATSYKDGFPWMDYKLPQENYDGVMNVSVAQHLSGHWSSEAFLARERAQYEYEYRGRSAYPNQKYAYETDSAEEAVYGANFASQWANAINYEGDEEVWMITITGWNEWVAQKLNLNGQYATFVDTFNIAFSRDAEMMRDAGGYADNFYMQIATNIALFKATDSSLKSNTAMWMRQTVEYDNLAAWGSVKAKYVDFVSDAMNRDEDSVGSVYRYTDTSARNDIQYLKLANDSEYLYVLVSTKDAVTTHQAGDTGWMNLYLATGASGGWESYQYLINRYPDGRKTSIERLSTDSSGKIATETLSISADLYVSGNCVTYRIPLEALNVTSANEIQIKACDNVFGVVGTDRNDGVGVFEFGDIMAFYCGGDCAPIGRLNYAYRMAY